MKTVTIHLDNDNKSFQLALVEGAESSALLQGVASKASSLLSSPIKVPSDFFLTLGGRDDAVVPLSTSLPDKMDLHLYLVNETSSQSTTTSSEHTASPDDNTAADNTTKPSAWRDALERLFLIEPSPHNDHIHHILHKSQHDTFTSIYHFNRLGTDLANERTMLAWIRTMLAAVRTVFAYLKYGE
jgi:hypothetical protein